MILRRHASTMIGLAALLTTLSACGSPEGALSPVVIAPASPDVEPGGTVQFAVNAGGAPDPTVAWAVMEPNGGTIDNAGTYTAPDTEGTYTVLASLKSTATTDSTPVRVKRNVHVDLSPSSATLAAGGSLTITATVTGSDKTVTWSIAEGAAGGTITAAGVYTAPLTTGTYTVVATSTADPTKSGRATMTVTAAPQPPPPAPTVAIAVSPQTASVVEGNALQFTATVTGSTNVAVVWSVAESGGGIVTANGLYTAPATAGTYHVVARSSADTTKTSSGAATVTAPPLTAPPPPSDPYGPAYVKTVTGGGPMPDWTTNVINVQSYGAKGDGVTDDTAAFRNAAIAARDQGKKLIVPATSAFYKLYGGVKIYGSIGGVNGTPTIKQTYPPTAYTGAIYTAPDNGGWAGGWIYNLHIVGAFDGRTKSSTDGGHLLGIGSSSNVTVNRCVIENAQGDSITTDPSAWDGGGVSSNVLIYGNTLRNPQRCNIALEHLQSNWVIHDNVFDKQFNYVTSIDFEAAESGWIENIEIYHNNFIMNNRVPYSTARAVDGKAWANWCPDTTPGGNLYLHHNYGTFGTGWYTTSYYGMNWFNVQANLANAEGPSP